MGWDFKERSTAEKLSNFAKSMTDPPTGRMRDYKSGNVNQQILVKTPSDGIPARSEVGSNETSRDEYQMGVAECKLLTTYDPTQTGGEQRNQQTLHTVGRPYAGTNETDWRDNYTPVYVANPYPSAIAGNKIVLAHYIDGSYVVAEPPEGTRLKFVLKTSLISGEATAYVLDPPPATAGNYDEVTVKDPKKLFYGAIGTEEASRWDLTACSPIPYYAEKPGAIGWAVYSGEIGGWEIEQCTLPIQRFAGEVPGGTTAPTQKAAGVIEEAQTQKIFVRINPQDSLSTYPHVDMPPEVMCKPVGEGEENSGKKLQVQALNPHRLTIIPGSTVTIERRVKQVPASEYTGSQVNPHENPEPSAGVIRGYEWVIVDAEKTIARWAKFKVKDDTGCEWEYDDASESYAEGESPLDWFGSNTSPAQASDITVEAAEGLLDGCVCENSQDGPTYSIPKKDSYGWGFWDNNETKYIIVSTKSAMLGNPTGTDYIRDVSDSANENNCSFSIKKTTGLIGWACSKTEDTIDQELQVEEIKYLSTISGGCNVICPKYEFATVLKCGANSTPYFSCMNIYADPCETCTGTCYWYWNGSEWTNDPSNEHDCVPDSDDCGCEGQEPPPWEIGQPVTQTTTCAVYNTPPEPEPCESCTECENQDLDIDTLGYSANNPGVASFYTMTGDATRIGDCMWEVPIEWSELDPAKPGDPPTTAAGTATVELSGGVWYCSVPPSPSGVGGDWQYIEPADPCQTSFLQKYDDQFELFTDQPYTATVTFSVSGPLCT